MSGAPSPPGTDGLLDVAMVRRAHGLKGEVVVELYTDVPGRLDPGSVLSLPDGGTLTVVESRSHQGRHLVLFEGVTDRSGADSLRGSVLRAPPAEVPGVLWVHQLLGAEMRSVEGRRLGSVVAVEPNPASDLLVLDGGGLVPLRFVVSHEPGVSVTVDIPDGLLD